MSVTKVARSNALDAARGLALVAMVIFHMTWDLANFGYIPRGVPHTVEMKYFGHAIAIAFLFIVGVSLVLAREKSADWRPFWRRILLVAGAAVLVSLGTYAVFPETFVFFGILHCIALASLLAAPLLVAPWPAALSAALVAILAPFFFSHPYFDSPWLTWIGFSTFEPPTNDYRPVLPWSGYVFLGVAAARFWLARNLPALAPRWRSGALSFAGRHSLAIYLIHQPLLFALFYAATLVGAPAGNDVGEFVAACEKRCLEDSSETGFCHSVCLCTANEARTGLSSIASTDTDARARRLDDIARACVAREHE